MNLKAAFAIPGDINTLTGGYVYEKRLLLELRGLGVDMEHVELPATFPEQSPAENEAAVKLLSALEPDRPVILDGFLSGGMDGLDRVRSPMVAMVHHPLATETGLSDAQRAHLFTTERRNLELMAHVLVPSPHTAEILRRDYGVAAERITIAAPGIDRPGGLRAPVSPPLILAVGLQHPRKGHDVLLRALAQVSDLPWQAVIAGRAHDPIYAGVLAGIVADLDLGDRVRLAGEMPRADLNALYAEASVFALATRYEGYGMVFAEALSWGLPIVTCNGGAVPDTVPAGAGLLTDVGDADAFAGSLRRVLTEAGTRAAMERAAAEAGLALPSWTDTARTALGVLDGLR